METAIGQCSTSHAEPLRAILGAPASKLHASFSGVYDWKRLLNWVGNPASAARVLFMEEHIKHDMGVRGSI